MAHRRCLQTISRHASALLSLKSPLPPPLTKPFSLKTQTLFRHLFNISSTPELTSWSHFRHFSSKRNDTDDEGEGEVVDEGEGEEEDEETEDEGEEGEEIDDTVPDLEREYTLEETQAEAAEIGYNVVGQLWKSDRVFKKYEPVFAVIQIGSHQFKVSNGDSIFTERLKFCEVNDKLILNKVLMLGSQSQTIIGRPMVPDAAVHAVVEEHALDAKVIIFKKKRRKNYRRTKGHRQELTKLRIIDIQGIEKPVNVATAA